MTSFYHQMIMKNFVFLVFNIALHFGIYECHFSCPLKEELVKCSCKTMWMSLSLECQSISKPSQLSQELQAISQAQLDLRIKYSRLAILTNNIFQGVTLRSLLMQNVILIGIEDHAFSGSEYSLRNVVITGHLMNAIPINALRPLTNLNLLDLSFGGQFDSLSPKNFSSSMSNLRSLMLAFCNIKHIGKDTFLPLRNLHLLDLSNNPLAEIQLDIIPQNNYLRELIIHSCDLTSLPSSFCGHFASLTKLDISHNLFQNLSQDSFSKCFRYDVSLSLKGNPLACNCSMYWMAYALQRCHGARSEIDDARCKDKTRISDLTIHYFHHKGCDQ